MKIRIVLTFDEAHKIVKAYRLAKTKRMSYLDIEVDVEQAIAITHADKYNLWFNDAGGITIRPYSEYHQIVKEN